MIGKIALLALMGLAAVSATRYSPELLGQFNAWQIQYKKVYDSVADFEHAMDNFKASLVRVAQKNAASNGENWAGLTKFSDLSPAEFKKIYLRATHTLETARKTRQIIHDVLPVTNVVAPTSFDWRTRSPSVVTAVKDQGQCGSCWAFATTESIESMWALAGNDIVELSPEQIVDCDTTDAGCNGGDTPSAFAYVTEAGGLDTETSYPYTAGSGDSGNCQFNPQTVGATINQFSWVIPECTGSCDSQSMSQVQAQLATVGPFAICVYAEPWQDYAGGVFNDATCTHAYTDLDHCVQLVGYTPNYWLVRNSWAADWGEAGYIYVSTKVAKGNLCGIMDEVNFANVTAKSW
jgi:C1A family cysteine protease